MTISGVKIKKADGTWDGGTPPAPLVQDFTTSGTWTKPDGARRVVAEIIGGGGAGHSAGGGQGGGFLWAEFDPDDLGPTEAVTVGAGAAAQGGDGGFSRFALKTAAGGKGATSSAPGTGASTVMATGVVNMWDSGGAGSAAGGASALLGAGGGSTGTSAPGAGGTRADAMGVLKAGNGGGWSAGAPVPATTPGGGGRQNSASAPGQVRITSYF